MKVLLDEGPLQSIKGLYKINLEDYVSQVSLFLLKIGDNLLENDGIIRGSSTRKESSLPMTDDISQVRLESSGNDFYDELIPSVTKPNRSKIFNSGRIVTYEDEIDISGVDFRIQDIGSKSVFTILGDAGP